MSYENENMPISLDGDVEYTGGSSLIPEGEYLFRIANMKREEVEAKGDMPKHINLKFQLKLENADGSAGYAWDNVRMYMKWVWKYSDLAKSIGHWPVSAAKGHIDLNRFVGAEGRVRVTITDWKKRDGTTEKQNSFKYLPPAEQPPEVPW